MTTESDIIQLKVYEEKHPDFFPVGTPEEKKLEYLKKIRSKEADDKLRAREEMRKLDAKVEAKNFSPLEYNTQILIAEGFVEAHKGNWIYNIDCKKWFFWNGKYWELDVKDDIRNVVKDHLKEYLVKIPKMLDNKQILDMTKFVVGLNTAKGIRDILSIAAPAMTVLDREFDTENSILNCQNGILDVNTLTLSIHNRNGYHSKIAGIEYNPVSTCLKWEKHIETIFDGDAGLIMNIQELLGYSLFLGNPDAVFSIFFGSGRNGKSVTLDVMHHVLGTYAVSVNPDCFMDDGGNPGGDRIKMAGARLITATEPADKKSGRCSLDSGFIKAATGNDVLSARRLYCEGVNFKVEGLVILATNTLPKIRDPSIAIWERIWCIPFNHYFGEDRNIGITDELKKEGSGILNWLIAGYKRYVEKKRLIQCSSISEQTEEYKSNEDYYSEFFSTCTVRGKDCKISSGALYSRFVTWYEHKHPGKTAMSITKFGRDMGSRFNKIRTEKGIFFVGICEIGQGKLV